MIIQMSDEEYKEMIEFMTVHGLVSSLVTANIGLSYGAIGQKESYRKQIEICSAEIGKRAAKSVYDSETELSAKSVCLFRESIMKVLEYVAGGKTALVSITRAMGEPRLKGAPWGAVEKFYRG